MKRIIVQRGEENRIRLGHPWVYDNEIDCVIGKDGLPAELESGECADVESSHKQYLGRAIVNPHSKIVARIYSPSKEGLDKGFFKRRIRAAVLRRSPFFDLARDSARIVFAEADLLPGLIIDRFVGWPLAALKAAVSSRPLTFELAGAALGPPESWLVLQLLSFGMDARREMIVEALEETVRKLDWKVTGLIEKSNARVRALEGLPLREGILRGEFPAEGIVIFENGLPFAVHLLEGQKTGYFLDQRNNHALAGAYAAMLFPSNENGRVRALDACSYSGAFGIHVVRAMANVELTAVDVSAAALEALKENAALNGLADRVTVFEADVFHYLQAAGGKKERFDIITLDPPAFAKSHTALAEAVRGYREINLRAIKLLRPGGLLVTCSCSQALDEARFKHMISEAAACAERRLVQIDFRSQPADHPILAGYDESHYLKCGYYRVTE